MLGITTAMGRTFLPEEDGSPGAHSVAILSDGLWHGRFGADPAVIGRPWRSMVRLATSSELHHRDETVTQGKTAFWIPISMGDSGDLTARQQQ